MVYHIDQTFGIIKVFRKAICRSGVNNVVFDVVGSIFTWIFVISLMLSIFISWGNRDRSFLHQEEQTEKTAALDSVVLVIIVITTLVTFVSGLILLGIKYENLRLLCFFVSTPLYLSYVTGAYQSVGIVKKVVQLESSKRLTVREQWAIQTMAYVLFFLNTYKLPIKFMANLKNVENTMASDLSYITVYILLLFIYVFLICALLPAPLTLFSTMAIKLNKLLRDKTKLFAFGEFFIEQIDKTPIIRSLLIKTIKAAKTRGVILYAIVLLLSPILFGTDICLSILRALRGILLESVGYVFLLMKMMKRTVGRLIVWMNMLSDRRLVAISFRVALIIALVLTVIINRYTPLFYEYESSTGVLEFVAGTILIPVIIEWISSAKTRRSTHEQTS